MLNYHIEKMVFEMPKLTSTQKHQRENNHFITCIDLVGKCLAFQWWLRPPPSISIFQLFSAKRGK